MRKPRSPWISNSALYGAAGGLALAVVLPLVDPSRLPGPRPSAWAVLPPAFYLIGVLVAYRRREIRDAQAFLELGVELRLSQDHIMTNETHRALGAYLEIAAHQMKEPLRALSSGLNSLVAGDGLSDEARARAESLRGHMDSLNGTLRHLAGYALTRPGRAPFSVNTLLHESILLCRHRAAEKKITFDERYGVVPPVMGSAMRVQQALFNIIVNAVEAMPFGGGTIEVTTA